MTAVSPSPKRRRLVTSCSECYRRKQKCDRQTPCNNCRARNVPTKCVYDVSGREPEQSVSAQSSADPVDLLGPIQGDPQASADLGYSLRPGSNSFLGLQQILGNDEFQSITAAHNDVPQSKSPKSNIEALLAKLPPRHVIEALVDLFFDAVNWHYFILERYYFDSLLSRWPPTEGMQPASYLSVAELSMELRYFPALLFQVIALALQFVPTGWDTVAGLQASRGSTLQYSDLGYELLSLLGRPALAITGVQAEFLRSTWLKNCGRGTESWHTLGSAIRQAQELGLHQHRDIHQSTQNHVSQTLSLFWYEENKKRLWVHLFTWDSFMAMVLGRPRMINVDDCDMTPPMDCNIPRDPSAAIPMAVRPEDSQGPIKISSPLFRYTLAHKVHKMRATKADNPRLSDYSVVKTLHEEIMSLLDETPPTLRLKNPDTTWDLEHPYLPQLRQELQVMINLFLIGLHRPHIVSHAESRRAVLQAGLSTLDCQQRSFARASQDLYHLFGLSFYTVDAAILVSIIAILFPPSGQNPKHKIEQSLQQAMEDLSHMQSSNPIARSGLRILQRCYEKLRSKSETPSSTSQPTTVSYSTPSDGLNDLIHDLGPQSFDLSAGLPPGPSQTSAITWPGSPDFLSQMIPSTFDEKYWLDQLSMIHPFVAEQDPSHLWENLYFE
ncbi:fungal-specific transcription factor domain-containing protein [Aspergillus unguis]